MYDYYIKMKVKAPAILKNKYVLYILLVVAIVNVLGYLAMEDYKSLGLFMSIGLLSTYFSSFYRFCCKNSDNEDRRASEENCG